MIHQLTERQKWFADRVGKWIYRNTHGCNCQSCKNVLENGIFINDEQHASYCYDIECDFNREGTPLRYFDTKEQVNEWLKSI